MAFQEEKRRTQINPLDGSNYHTWSKRMKLYLECKEVWDVVTIDTARDAMTPDELKKDKTAKWIIVDNLDDAHLQTVGTDDSAGQVWKSLAKMYTEVGFSRMLRLKEKLYTTKKEKGQDMRQYLKIITDITIELESMMKN